MIEKSLGRYLHESYQQGIIDFCLRIHEQNGVINFYIRPADKDGETADFHVIGNLVISSVVNGVIVDWAAALQADCKSFAAMPDYSCPKCSTVLHDVYLERPWFVATDGGRQANTPHGPGETWVEGIQVCAECGHQWEVQA